MKPNQLPPEQQDEALRRYYGGERIQSIIDAYNLDCVPSNFLRGFPRICLADKLCPHCGVPMEIKRACRRPGIGPGASEGFATCPQCRHVEDSYCQCRACLRQRRFGSAKPQGQSPSGTQAVLAAAWEDAWASRPEPEDLSVRKAVYLLAATRGGLDRAQERLPSVRTLSGRIAPGIELTREIMRTLTDAKLITMDPAASLDCDVLDPRHYLTLYFESAHWRLALGDDGRANRRYLDRLLALVTTRWSFDAQGEELAYIWFQVILDECLTHLEGQLAHFGLDPTVTLTLRDTLASLLAHLSGGEVIAATWSASKSVAAERHAGRGRGDPSVAVAAQLRSLFDGFVDGRLTPFSYERSRHNPVSTLAELLIGPVGGLGADYLRAVPLHASLAARHGRAPIDDSFAT